MGHTVRIIETEEPSRETGHSVSREVVAREFLSVLPRLMRSVKHHGRYAEGAGELREMGEMQVMSLFTLLHAGKQLTGELARRFNVTNPTMTHNIDELVRRGLVERQPDTEDRRKIFLSLTDEGRRLATTAHEQACRILAEYLGPLTNDELSDVMRAMGHLRRLLPDMAQEQANCPAPEAERARQEGSSSSN